MPRIGKQPVSVDSTSSETLNSTNERLSQEYGNSSNVWVGRIVFFSFLVAVSASLGYATFHFLRAGETDLADAEYEAKVSRAMNQLATISTNKLLGCFTAGKLAANFNPDLENWPLISIPGYYDIVSDIVPTSVGGMSVSPMLFTAEDMASFETYAYEAYGKFFPNETVAESSFGRGIWAPDSSLDKETVPDQRYHRTNPSSPWGSPYNFSTPKYMHSAGNHRLLLMDTHARPVHGHAIDGAYNCSLERAQAEDPSQVDCQTVSDIVPPSDPTNPKKGPGAFIVTPIYAANAPTFMVGITFAKVNWIQILESLALNDVTGIDAVISTPSNSFTYTVIDGEVLFRGEGDLHDVSRNLNQACSNDFLQSGRLSNSSVVYVCSFYPNDHFYDTYHTSSPVVASVGVVVIILFTSVFFFLYDFFVCREFNAKQQLLHAKRHFVRFVSHEVRTPLNSVVMGLTLLQEELARALGYDEPEQVLDDSSHSKKAESSKIIKSEGLRHLSSWYDLTREVQDNAQTSVDVLNDLLNYDKVEAGKLSLELSVLPIWEMVRETVREFKLPAAKKDITLEVKLPEDIEELACQKVIGDAVRLAQVLRNLISNAIKFTVIGGSIKVTAGAEAFSKDERTCDTFELRNKESALYKRTGSLVLEVQDSGAGMSEEQLSNLFRPGVQFNVNELQAGNGSGLGLFIAKGIVEQHNGCLRATSPGLGQGTSFIMSVPLYHVEDAPCQATLGREPIEVSMASNFEQTSLKILVVDDATSNLKLLMRLLGNRRHTCTGAVNGQEAVDAVKAAVNQGEPFNMVLLDYEMPVMNGPTAAKTMRGLGLDVFIVGVTGNMLAEDVDFFKDCGANAVLAKPFQVTQLEELCVEYGIQGDPTPTEEV